jgi:hypothetical protein
MAEKAGVKHIAEREQCRQYECQQQRTLYPTPRQQQRQHKEERRINQTREHIAPDGIRLEWVFKLHRHGQLRVHKQQIDHRQSKQQQELVVHGAKIHIFTITHNKINIIFNEP